MGKWRETFMAAEGHILHCSIRDGMRAGGKAVGRRGIEPEKT